MCCQGLKHTTLNSKLCTEGCFQDLIDCLSSHYCLQILLTKPLGCTLCLFVLSILLTFKWVCGFYAPRIEHYSFLSSAPKIIYYAFKKMPIISKIMPLNLANNVSL